jgi:glycine betaine/proline transport system permease protein
MDPVTTFIRSWKLPVGPWGKTAIDFIVTYFQWLFDALKISLNFIVENTTWGLLAIPPVLLAVLIAAFAYWLQKSWKLALGVFLVLLVVIMLYIWRTGLLEEITT